MARALLISDGFDAYNDLTQQWDFVSGSTSIDITGTLSRSGLGCMVINTGGGGANRSFTPQTAVIVTGALNETGLGDQAGNAGPMFQLNSILDGEAKVGLASYVDGSVGVLQNTLVSGTVLARSAPGLIRNGTYNFFALMVTIGSSGAAKVWANGVKVLDVTGINTGGSGPHKSVDQVALRCQGGGVVGYWDDFMLWSFTDIVADEFPLMPSVLPWMPNADTTPLQWTPSTNMSPHFAMVNAVPPNLSNDNFSQTVGAIDQYIHQIPSNQLKRPLGPQVQVLAINHKMLAALDAAGARSIASNMGGVQGPNTFALSTTPKFYQTPYTPGITNINQMNTTGFGPEVVA